MFAKHTDSRRPFEMKRENFKEICGKKIVQRLPVNLLDVLHSSGDRDILGLTLGAAALLAAVGASRALLAGRDGRSVALSGGFFGSGTSTRHDETIRKITWKTRVYIFPKCFFSLVKMCCPYQGLKKRRNEDKKTGTNCGMLGELCGGGEVWREKLKCCNGNFDRELLKKFANGDQQRDGERRRERRARNVRCTPACNVRYALVYGELADTETISLNTRAEL